MSMCSDLEQQKSTLQSNLAAVENEIDNTSDPKRLQELRAEEAQLHSQISHVDTLINQNCSAVRRSAALALPGSKPAAESPQLKKARKDYYAALKLLTAKSLALSKAILKSHKLSPAPKTASRKSGAKKNAVKKAD